MFCFKNGLSSCWSFPRHLEGQEGALIWKRGLRMHCEEKGQDGNVSDEDNVAT